MAKAMKAPVSVRAVVQRINRKLAHNDEKLRVTRGRQMQMECGDYHIINFSMNAVVNKDVDPEALGRELGVLKDWETVTE
jgi:hypothetical protein